VVDANQGLTILAPQYVGLKMIEAVVRKRSTWICRKLGDARAAFVSFSTLEFVSGDTIRYLGRCYRLRVIESEQIQRNCRLIGGWLELAVRPELNETQRVAAVTSQIVGWYRFQAENRLSERLGYWSERYGFEAPRLVISAQEKRWGSCGPDNCVRINWRVMMAPQSLVDYVLAHELAHVTHKNHSDQFWRLLGSVMPDYDRRRDELKRFGGQINL
jgi:predicted metal-dependent hydrolase